MLQQEVENEAEDDAGEDVDGVVGADVDGGEAHQQEEREDDVEEATAAGAPGQEQQDERESDMTAGEGGRGAFAGHVGNDDEVVEQSAVVAGHVHHLVVGHEVVAEVGEDTLTDVVESDGEVIELWARDGEDDEDDVEQEERGEDDEGHALELLIALEEVVNDDGGNKWEVGGVA